MRGRYLTGSKDAFIEHNIYADKSSLILDWLLRVGIDKKQFSIREVAKDRGVSVGLVQRVFKVLVMNGILQSEGLRTAKKFKLTRPHLLLTNWLKHYSITKKCKMWTYQSGFQGRHQIYQALEASKLKGQIALALHSSAEVFGYKNTNLQTVELYLVGSHIRKDVEEALDLEPQERGYEVLLIEPYYKSLLSRGKEEALLLTFLDLFHFPLRGREQAEFIAEREATLKRIYKKGN